MAMAMVNKFITNNPPNSTTTDNNENPQLNIRQPHLTSTRPTNFRLAMIFIIGQWHS
jgi:hypothetical protein